MRERQKFHVSMQGNVDVSSNASHSAGLLPRGRKTSCVRRIAVEETRRKIDRHLVGRSYTLVHTHARNTRARAYTLLMPLRYFIAGANMRIDTRAYTLFRALARPIPEPLPLREVGRWVQRSLNHILCNVTHPIYYR